MKVYIYQDMFKRLIVYKSLKVALKENYDLDWIIKSYDNDPCNEVAHTSNYCYSICELEVKE